MEDKVRYVFVPQLMRHRSQSVFREHYSTIQSMQWPVGCASRDAWDRIDWIYVVHGQMLSWG